MEKSEKMQAVINMVLIMGLSFNEKDNYLDNLEREIVVFNGANAQRVLIDTKLDWNDIYKKLGDAPIKYGEIKKATEINSALKPW
tara:strand:- start:4643 stop:4897 length:255 start_codon:yes stop_codon:yes gene_type:complete